MTVCGQKSCGHRLSLKQTNVGALRLIGLLRIGFTLSFLSIILPLQHVCVLTRTSIVNSCIELLMKYIRGGGVGPSVLMIEVTEFTHVRTSS